MKEIYDPFRATVESILEMCEKYAAFEDERGNDFLNNIRVKCKDAIEFDKNFLQNMDKDLKKTVDSYYHMHADKNLDYMFLAKTASHFANWQKRQMKKTDVSEELEKVSNEYAEENKTEWWGGHSYVDDSEALKLAVQFGANWANKC